MNKPEPEYTIIDMKNTLQSTKAYVNKLLSQIPAGKAIAIPHPDQMPQNRTLVKVMNIEDIPPIKHPMRTRKNILTKAGFKQTLQTDKPKPQRKRKYS